MINRDVIAPRVLRSVDNGGLPINFVVPAGQVYRIMTLDGNNDITATQIISVVIDGKTMFWFPGVAEFAPMLFNLNERAGLNQMMKAFLEHQFMGIIADEGQTVAINSGDGTGSFAMVYQILGSREKYNRLSDGGVDGKRRMIFTCGRQVTSVGAGLTVDIVIVTPQNAPGNTTFPYGTVAPPQRKYLIHAFAFPNTNVCGTNLTFNSWRLVHEGRELVNVPGLAFGIDRLQDWDTLNGASWKFFPEPYEINAFETLQIIANVVSADLGAQNATLSCLLLVTEEYLQ